MFMCRVLLRAALCIYGAIGRKVYCNLIIRLGWILGPD